MLKSNEIWERAPDILSHNWHWFLVAIVIFATGIRVWGIAYDLPYIYHPDEVNVVYSARQMLQNRDLNPRFFLWPSLIIYLNAILYTFYYLGGKLLGVFSSPSEIPSPIMIAMAVGKMPVPGLWILSRLLTISFGIGTILLTYISGRKLTRKRAVGLLAAIMLAVSATSVANNRLITPDTFSSFFVMLALFSAVSVLQEGKLRYYILAGIAIGLAGSSKYNGVVVSITLVMAHFARYSWQGFKRYELYLSFFISVLVFAISMPYAILDFASFSDALRLEARHYATGHFGMEGNTPIWYITYLWQVEGPVILLALIMVVLALYRRSKPLILLVIFPVIYFLILSRFAVRNGRNLMPLIPFLYLMAAVVLVDTSKWQWGIQKSAKSRVLSIALIAVCLVVIIIPLVTTININQQITRVDSRETARVWIEDNLPEGSRIAIEPYSPFINPAQYSVTALNYHGIDRSRDWYQEKDFDYIVFSEGSFGRFYLEPEKYQTQITQYAELIADFKIVKAFNDGDYEVRIYEMAD